MIVQYDMATGQCIEESQPTQASPKTRGVPVATLSLQAIDESGLDHRLGHRRLPADLASVPVERFLAKQSSAR